MIWVLCALCVNAVQAKHLTHVDDSRPVNEKTALMIMNGFGGAKAACKKQMAFWQEQGMDVFIPDVLLRRSLELSSEAFDAFVENYGISAYAEVRVICYIAGAFLLHTHLESHELLNLKSIIYDRSPTQERAPQAVMEAIPALGMLRLGKVLRDLSVVTWPNPPSSKNIHKGLVIENRATKLMRSLEDECRSMGPLEYDWHAIDSSAADAFHVALDHNMMYRRWDVLGDACLYFFAHGLFPSDLPREPLTDNPFDIDLLIP
jgi:hypothetical protein